eukprot:m.78459 g.78459  ORF g.78459 m.78459 type:complete len:75 (+) comp10713_c0_seq1:41-265(+)
MASMVAASLAVTVAVGAAGDGQRPPGTIRYHRRGRLSGTGVTCTLRLFGVQVVSEASVICSFGAAALLVAYPLR